MVINDFKNDIQRIMKMEEITQSELATKLNTTQQSISKAMTRRQMNDLFVSMLDAMGYDVKITYVKREESAKEVLHKGV